MVAMDVTLRTPDMAATTLTADLADEAATARLAAAIAGIAQHGDVIALHGDLGTGKTVFARGFLRALGVKEDVPSPTFTLVQTYETSRGTVAHFDLYRIETEEDVYELGVEDAFSDAICLIEWPDRLGGLLPDARLDVLFDYAASGRRVRITPHGDWIGRLPADLPHV